MTLDEAFAHLPILTTNRLRIRKMQMTDAEALFAIKSDPEVTRHYGQEPHRSLDETRACIQRRIADYERRDTIFWAITSKNEDAAIAACCFWNFDLSFHCAEIGYELHPTYWHKGIMSEALPAVLGFGFVDLGLHRIEANPLAINEPSKKLLLKLGFRHEGTLRQRHFFGGQFVDQLCFGLLKGEWTNESTRL
jgi:ribosomal-protein-alanine N-acetyltransferase